ncbi:ABC transporter ATP-binding protein [Spirosoma aerolatum]|uniref:ABC transporter ATP-binding protein n=1 Tax=Spirosoma aerolatum TaxID=1211326 RepID=UPI0009AD30DE|nr:ABC transporter ATP-binding protein [Spirosoma aerolatum]
MKPIIKVENLSKQYRLGTIGTGTLREDVQRWWHQIRGKEDPYLKIGETNERNSKGQSDYVWALKDINFEVMPGEVLGIIGKNGAGKSTLLKILSKVTGPTIGRINFNGRIGSLLEVGTGFHPDLTGRENIFLNGAILGMTKREIRSKLDEIIDFSGCERYVDTPVKRYSSGMTVRLGFAVAAHLDPEILVVDEVLAVGDAEFQKKAIGKMQDVSRNEGRTVLFVSHNLNAISLLCNRAILIENGQILVDGFTEKIINRYIENQSILASGQLNLETIKRDKLDSDIIFRDVRFNEYPVKFGNDIEIILKLKQQKDNDFQDLEIGVGIYDIHDKMLIHTSNKFISKTLKHKSDHQEYVFIIKNNLSPQTYRINLFLKTEKGIQDWLQNIVSFEILDGNPYKYMNSKQIEGVIFPDFEVIER